MEIKFPLSIFCLSRTKLTKKIVVKFDVTTFESIMHLLFYPKPLTAPLHFFDANDNAAKTS